MAQQEQWHLDKKVPISIIGTIVAQTLIFVYIGTAWKADVENRLHALEKEQNGISSHETRIVVIEQGMLRIRDDLSEIKQLIRQQKMGKLDDPSQPQQ